MSVVIIIGKHKKAEVESGIDIFAELIFQKNGKGKRFLGVTTCNFRGKEIPCMVRWSDNGSIKCEILTDIFHTLDLYDLFPRQTGLTPFALMDAHGRII